MNPPFAGQHGTVIARKTWFGHEVYQGAALVPKDATLTFCDHEHRSLERAMECGKHLARTVTAHTIGVTTRRAS